MERITPKRFKKLMHDIFRPDAEDEWQDVEDTHYEADLLMLRVLKSLGYEEGCEIFEQADKWYS